MHDPRVGRFFATDPLEAKYPFYTPYQFSGNRVIDCSELEGLEPRKEGTLEGETAKAYDDQEIANFQLNGGAGNGGMPAFTEYLWVMHMGTSTTAKEWYKEANYKQIIQPFAIQAANADGWHFAKDWMEARASIKPGDASEMSAELKDFLSIQSRGFDGSETGFYNGDKIVRDILSDYGKSLINSYNASLYYPVTGNCTAMGIDDPFVFLFAGVVKNCFTGVTLNGSTFFARGYGTATAASYISNYKGLAEGFTNFVMHGEQFNILSAGEISAMLTERGITGDVRLWVCEGGADVTKLNELATMRNIRIQASPFKIRVTPTGYTMMGSENNLFELYDGTCK